MPTHEIPDSPMVDRERVSRNASPSAAVIDSQSFKTSKSGVPRGYDTSKKIMGRKRHGLVDTDGRALKLFPHRASAQDLDGGLPVINASRGFFPSLRRFLHDTGY